MTTRSGPHFGLGMVYEKQLDRDQTRAEYEQALRINPRTRTRASRWRS
ncbi:MAG: hypothetical protein ABR499_06115 [Gemmatimonadaceae bacterium]